MYLDAATEQLSSMKQCGARQERVIPLPVKRLPPEMQTLQVRVAHCRPGRVLDLIERAANFHPGRGLVP